MVLEIFSIKKAFQPIEVADGGYHCDLRSIAWVSSHIGAGSGETVEVLTDLI